MRHDAVAPLLNSDRSALFRLLPSMACLGATGGAGCHSRLSRRPAGSQMPEPWWSNSASDTRAVGRRLERDSENSVASGGVRCTSGATGTRCAVMPWSLASEWMLARSQERVREPRQRLSGFLGVPRPTTETERSAASRLSWHADTGKIVGNCNQVPPNTPTECA